VAASSPFVCGISSAIVFGTGDAYSMSSVYFVGTYCVGSCDGLERTRGIKRQRDLHSRMRQHQRVLALAEDCDKSSDLAYPFFTPP